MPQRMFSAEEKAKIKKVIDNRAYQLNPVEAMKSHIKNAQLIAERNKKIDENFQKNYNFLNMKKFQEKLKIVKMLNY